MEGKKKPLVTVSQFEVFKNRKRILQNPLPFHQENFEKHGDTFLVNIGIGNKVVFTRDAETIKHILQKNHKNYYKSSLQTKDLAKYIGHGLLTTNGDFWRTHRRMVQPAFHKKKLQGLLGIMYKSITDELNRIEPESSFDIFPLMGDIAFQVVAQALFSADDLRSRMVKLQRITEANQRMLIKEMRQPFKKWWFQLSGQTKKHLNLSEDARELLNGIIQDRIDSSEEKDDLLDMLLSAKYEDGSSMSRQQIIDEVMILFTAGHETTANALSFSLFLLAKNPKIQNQLFEEVKHFDIDSDLMSGLNNLSFTEQCIEEAMRLYPPVYVIDRVSLTNDSIGGHEFEKGTVWLMSMYELHRHKDFWENSEEFRPMRFGLSNRKDYSSCYYPFGAGPRMCVGNNFAMFEMIMVVASIFKKYRVTTEIDNIEINPLISLKPKKVPLRFELR